MAKIAFFTERAPSHDDDISLFSSALIQSLADQHHDIRIFTTDDGQDWNLKHARIEIVRPFRKWSWWETAKLVPLLALDAPDILHVIQPRRESISGFGPSALNFLSALVSFPTRPKLVVSLYELDSRALEKIRPILQMAQLILVRHKSQKDELVANWKVHERQVQVLTALSIPSEAETEESFIPLSLSSMTDSSEQYLFIPGGLDQHSDLGKLFSVLEHLSETDQNLKFVVQGSWSDLPISKRHDWQTKFKASAAASRTLFTGAISQKVETLLLKSASLVMLASLDPLKLKFWKHSRNALKLGVPVVISEAQARTDELEWSETGMALSSDKASDIAQVTIRYLNDPELRERAQMNALELADRQVTDQPANQLTRMYLDLLSKK